MIREFFVNEAPKFLFKQFGLIHCIFITIPIIVLIIMYINRNKISKIPVEKSKKILKIGAIYYFLVRRRNLELAEEIKEEPKKITKKRTKKTK